MELQQYFFHEHPLNFKEDPPRRHDGRYKTCYACWKQVSGPNFSCKVCSWVVLHKSCAELPRELRHPFTPNIPFLSSMLNMKIVKAYARVAIEVLKGTSFTNVLTVILSLRLNVLLCRSPSKLKVMPTH
jgi:hypothetical protein